MSQRVIEIVAYNPGWVEDFDREKSKLENALKGVVVAIYHVGSTSVPGLSAKPIIDILMEVSDLGELDRMASVIEPLGYRAKGENGIVGRRYFQKGGNSRSHHLHAYKSGDDNLIRHIAFRDYLREHRVAAAEYERLKWSLVAVCENEPSRYQAGKDAFLQQCEEIALEWYRTTNYLNPVGP